MTQVEAIAQALRSFNWGDYAASTLENGLCLGDDRFVEPLARHIREQIQGSRWQPIDPATGTVAESTTTSTTEGTDESSRHHA